MQARWFVRGDLDGFFGLFIDNLLQLMLIASLCPIICGFSTEMIAHQILPGAAFSILFGNIFYAWQARRLARETGRDDITALPYGINTVSLFAFIFLVMGPIYQETHSAKIAWQAGIFACFLNGVMELVGAYAGDALRRHTPRAALLSALAGVAITFIAMGFIFQIFAVPAIALLPMMMILIPYSSGVRLPFGVSGGMIALIVGVALGWGLRALGHPYFHPSTEAYAIGVHLPKPVPADLFALIADRHGWKYLAVIFPMGLFNIIGSLQNLESAEAAGDRFPTRSSLLANGFASIVASLFGSAFPTTIYIGHPGWKSMGARSGYSLLNGIVITGLCLVGGVTLVLNFVPLEAMLGILLWIGLIITAQAFQETPRKHALAVALGLIPSLAAWALLLIETSLRIAGSSLYAQAARLEAELHLNGVIGLSQGFLLSSMVLSAMLVFMIERQFLKAAFWSMVAAVLSASGLIHAFTLTPMGVQNKFGFWAAPEFALAYTATALVLAGFHVMAQKTLST